MKKMTHSIALVTMKVTLVQLLIMLGAFCSYATKTEGQTALDQPVTLHLRNEKIKDVLAEIEKVSDVRFIYSPEIIRSSRKVNISASNKKLELLLSELLSPLNLKFELQKLKYSYIVLSKISVSVNAAIWTGGSVETAWIADTIRARGVVKDDNNTAMEGVTVTVKGSATATMTNSSGAYSIRVPEKGAVLVFSYAGMETQEISVTGSGIVNVVLASRSNSFDELIIVGYGQQKKGLVTGAISSVKAEEIATVSSTRIEQALQGRTAGVTVLPSSGSPGNGMRVRIRGTGSNLSADPLYIVDGIRAGGIEYLDPSEIASLEILKDAASAAIYGAEGANGVILVTTKTGKRNGPPEINYSMQYGRQSVGRKMPMMNPAQYVDYLKTSNTNVPNPLPDANALKSIQGTNWFDEIFENAPIQRHSLNVSGGTEKSSYLMGGTFFSQQGIIGGDKAQFDRYTFRINMENRIKSWLTIGERLSYSHFRRKGVTEDSEFGSVINNALMLDPITPVVYKGTPSQYFLDKIAGTTPDGTPISSLVRKDPNGNYYGISPYVFGEIGNPIAQMDITHTQTSQNKVVGNAYMDIEPIRGLKFTSRFGIDGAFQQIHTWNPTFWWSSERLNTKAGSVDRNDNWFTWQWENFATYQRVFGDHNITLLAGTSALKATTTFINTSAAGMFRELDIFSYPEYEPDDFDRVNGTKQVKTLSSYYGRITYDYKGRYLLTGVVRRDGSSLVAPGHEWGTFPSVSAGWVLSNEGFYSDKMAGVMNYFKLRASWGKNGSLSNLTPGQWSSGVGTTDATTAAIQYPDATGNNLVGAVPATLPNPLLSWEKSEQTDIGADMSFLNSRLNVTVDYYKKNTIDLITPGQGATPTYVGAPVSVINSGNIENRGWEFDVNYKSPGNHAFKYEISGNLTTLHNEVVETNEYVNKINGVAVGTGWTGTMFQKGYPVWYFSGYKTNGIFQNQAQINDYMSKNGITGYSPKPGDPVVVDVNGDKQISPQDQTYIGSPHPKMIYGARVNLSYKGFDLIAFIQGQSGNDVLMGFNRGDRATANKPAFFYDRRWTGDGSTNSWFAPNTSSEYIYNSDFMIFNASYARMRQLQLGYTLPAPLLKQIRFKTLRVYISLDDFFTFTGYEGLDPEAGSEKNNSLGIDRGVYPIPKKVLAGLSLTF